MQVIVKEREFTYNSDYPEGWKYSAGDPFKYPVNIGNYSCFIKRFEKKNPEDISGWALLQDLQGKFETNLVRIYDIVNIDEKGKDIYYVFQEYLPGTTLNKKVELRESVELEALTEDLFKAIQSLQKYKFWFADFCEKNIFCNNKGDYLLVDLDSTYPIDEAPNNNMYGTKDYWILVVNFYRDVLKNADFKLSDINSIAFNYLQIPFLVLRLKLFYAGVEKDYNSTAFFNSLPQTMAQVAPDIQNLYTGVLKNGKGPLSDEVIQQILTIVKRSILTYHPQQTIDVPAPQINSFIASTTKIKNGENYTLSWKTTDTDRLELIKNGDLFKQLNDKQGTLTLQDYFVRKDTHYQYILVAYHKNLQVRSNVITINQKTSNAFLKVFLILLMLALMTIAGWWLMSYKPHHQVNVQVLSKAVLEGSTITLRLSTPEDSSTIAVFIEDMAASKIKMQQNDLIVRVPEIPSPAGGQEPDTVNVAVKTTDDGQTVYSSMFPFIKKRKIVKWPLQVSRNIYRGTDLSKKGESANWVSGNLTAAGDKINAYQLKWADKDDTAMGFATADSVTMVDGKRYWALRVQPKADDMATISGLFPEMRIPGLKKFESTVGLTLNEAIKTDVTFKVILHYVINGQQKDYLLINNSNVRMTYLTELSADLPSEIGDDPFSVELRVDTKADLGNIYALWINPQIKTSIPVIIR